VLPPAGGFLAHPPARRQAYAVLDERLLGASVDPRVNYLVADHVSPGIGGKYPWWGVCHTPARASGALIWRGVRSWDKPAITRRRRTTSQSNRRFLERRLAARAALPASSARYSPSGPVWRAISRHTTEGLRPIKRAIRTWDKPAPTPPRSPHNPGHQASDDTPQSPPTSPLHKITYTLCQHCR